MNKLILRDRNEGMVEAWQKSFRNVPNVEIGQGDIFDVEADAITSPANSFAFMNGGIDAIYTKRFGQKLQDKLQKYIVENHYGEIIVGEAVIVPIDDDSTYKWLIAAPTMRVPTDISGTVNAYLAMRAILKVVKDMDVSVLCPGLGVGIGNMSYGVCASQMKEAYKVVMENKPWKFYSINESYRHHEILRRGLY